MYSTPPQLSAWSWMENREGCRSRWSRTVARCCPYFRPEESENGMQQNLHLDIWYPHRDMNLVVLEYRSMQLSLGNPPPYQRSTLSFPCECLGMECWGEYSDLTNPRHTKMEVMICIMNQPSKLTSRLSVQSTVWCLGAEPFFKISKSLIWWGNPLRSWNPKIHYLFHKIK